MAWTSWGFDGTINEAQWSQMAGLLGNGYVAAGNGDCLVTAVPGARSVSVAAGTLYGDGVVSVNSGAETVAMTTPVNGQWFVIALRRTWASNTAALVSIAGATTTTTTPTVAPSSFPTLNTSPGTLTDQPIAWAWCNSANTTVVVFDIRLKAVKSMPPVVANAAERDAKFMAPTQGLQVWRDDLGAVETYYGLYNVSTNPGGRNTAGWYTNDRQTGITPIKAATLVPVSGTATQNSLGKVTVTNCSKIQFQNVFTSQYTNYYIVITNLASSAAYAELFVRTMGGSSERTTSNYYATGTYVNAGTVYAWNLGGTAQTSIAYFDPYAYSNGTLDIFTPLDGAKKTGYSAKTNGYSSSHNVVNMAGMYAATTADDGISFIASTGTFSGEIQIFGVNS